MRCFAHRVAKFLKRGLEELIGLLSAKTPLEAPGWTGVAPLANRKVIAAKGSLAIVAGHATLPTSRRMMVKRFRSSHLPTLRHAGSYLMAFIACHLLMFRVTETDAIRLR
jgi:hypothetical protein